MALAWGEPCLAPAKINEFLHIIEQYPNGYHRLQTVFRLIDFSDTLYFYPRQDGQIRLVSALEGIDQQNDLASRAAEALKAFAHRDAGVDIKIDKNIPLGSGLGGGSSNAATALMALNELWGLHLKPEILAEIGLNLGADVPFFLFGQDAFADGVGEQLTALDLPECVYLLLFPPVSVPTAKIFAHPDLERSAIPICPQDYHPGFGKNMLTPIATQLFPIIQTYLDLLSFTGTAAMSGSGATVFARFPNMQTACDAQQKLPSAICSKVVPSLQQHPLKRVLS